MSEHDALVDRLRRAALVADPPPAGLEGAARAAFGLSRLDAELAELLHDSADETVLVRGAGDEPRLVSFGTDDVAADVEITPGEGSSVVTGTVHGPVAVASLETPDTSHELTPDQHGRFRVDAVTGAAVRVRMETESGVTVVTPWIRLG